MLKGDTSDTSYINSQVSNVESEIHRLRFELDNEIYLHDKELHKLAQRILSLEIIVGVSIASLVAMFYVPVHTVLLIAVTLLLVLATVPWGVFTGIAQGVKGFIQLMVIIPAKEAWELYRPKGDDDE